jgi:hypothetical protein
VHFGEFLVRFPLSTALEKGEEVATFNDIYSKLTLFE